MAANHIIRRRLKNLALFFISHVTTELQNFLAAKTYRFQLQDAVVTCTIKHKSSATLLKTFFYFTYNHDVT